MQKFLEPPLTLQQMQNIEQFQVMNSVQRMKLLKL